MALGLGTFASVAGCQTLSKLNLYNNKFQLLTASKDKDFAVAESTALKERAAAKKLLYGAATSYYKLRLDVNFATSFRRECAILMAEGDLLWSSLCPSKDNFVFERADWVAEFARSNNMLFGAAHLVWHGALPSWFKDAVNQQNARNVMLEYIEKVAGRYSGKVHFWTVVNEAVLPQDGRSDGLRNTPWLEFLGPDYIEMAFRAAAKADPNTLLVYNEYGLEYDFSDQEARRTAVLKLLERLKSRGTPLHALGIQAHLWSDSRFNPKKLQNFLREVANLDLKILITEMDVRDKELPRDIKVRDRIIAGVYEDYLSVVLDEPAVMSVTTWGLSDRFTWLSSFEPRDDGASVRPLPLDVGLNRKLAWNAIARAFDRTPRRESASTLWNAWENLSQST